MDIRDKKSKGIFVLSVLMILCICFVGAVSFFAQQDMANAITDADLADTTKYFDLGDLLFNGYEAKSKIFNGDQLDMLYAALLGKAGKTINDIKSATNGTNAVRTSSDFRNTYTANKNIVVTLGGYKWNVVYLSNTNADGTGDPIVTLWLANSSVTAQWNTYATSASVGNYPSNMYSSSMIRTLTLNNAGTYYEDNSGGKPHTVTPSESNPFALFTMENSSMLKGSLYDFIESPSNVYWQGTLSAKDNVGLSYNVSNDAYIPDPTSAGFNSPSNNYYNKTGYTDWQQDMIWLPAISETGASAVGGVSGLWQTDAFQRSNASGLTDMAEDSTWLRSASFRYYSSSYSLAVDGTSYAGYNATSKCAVRPAIHLNLNKAEQNASRKITTKKVEKEYNGLEQGVEKESWYIGANLDKNATITYYDATTASVMSTKPKNVGNYEAEITLKNDDYYWENAPEKSTVKIAFDIVKKKLEYPKFFDGNNAMPYAGGDDVEFQLEKFEPDYIKIEVPSKYGNDVKYNDTSQSITAIKVGKYELTVTLEDTSNTEWEAGTHKLEFEVTKAKVGVSIT
ncbi:MAG: hypothetical protein K2I78_00825, partial [Clostridia bacterium]|nr:hypothetical protein [Clostridia bacterium]